MFKVAFKFKRTKSLKRTVKLIWKLKSNFIFKNEELSNGSLSPSSLPCLELKCLDMAVGLQEQESARLVDHIKHDAVDMHVTPGNLRSCVGKFGAELFGFPEG